MVFFRIWLHKSNGIGRSTMCRYKQRTHKKDVDFEGDFTKAQSSKLISEIARYKAQTPYKLKICYSFTYP